MGLSVGEVNQIVGEISGIICGGSKWDCGNKDVKDCLWVGVNQIVCGGK